VLTSNKGFEEWGEIFGDEVMAAALIDRLVHHCHLVTIRGNSYRMRQHTELWRRCTHRQTANPPADAAEGVRRSRRTEARPLADLSDFQSAELSDFAPALTAAVNCRPSYVS
jgi:IstB-like ATP binding protein